MNDQTLGTATSPAAQNAFVHSNALNAPDLTLMLSTRVGGVPAKIIKPGASQTTGTASFKPGARSKRRIWTGQEHFVEQIPFNLVVNHPGSCRHTPTYFTQKNNVVWELEKCCGLKLPEAEKRSILGFVGAFLLLAIAHLTLCSVVTADNQRLCSVGQYDSMITEQAAKFGIPANIALAICHAESSGNPGATGPGGERGLFQITQSTWTKTTSLPWGQAFNPVANTKVALTMLSRFKPEDYRNYISFHNAGVRDWRKLSPKWSVNHPNNIYRAIYRGEL